MENNNSEPQLAQETVNKINSIINKNKDKIFVSENNNSEPLSENFISLDRFGHSFEIKSFETLNKEDYIFAPSNQFKNGLAIHKDLANEIENAIKAFTYPSNEKIYDIARQVGMAIGAQNQFSLPNWDLAKNNNQEPHIITVGMGAWRKLKSLDHVNLYNRNNEKNITRVLDIGQLYNSSRGLTGNVVNEENLQILSNEIDKYFLDKKIGTLSESDNKNLERIFRETRKFSAIPHNIIADDEYTSLPISKPFFEEKYIPTEREFKEEAKKLKVTGNFSSLGAAQNELAKRYGFKEYRAIKSRFPESSKSYDNINTILIHTYKLNEIEHSEINDFLFKFRHIFRKLNLAIGILNQGNILENVETRLYEKKLESLHIQENNLMQIYSYFLTENSIIFGQIKRNIQKLSQDEKINLLNDLNDLEIAENDIPAFGLFANLLAYHIGKSAGDVTLHKNEDGTVEQRFEEL